MNKTLPNPYYLFSFQHIASKERISFFPQVITSNVRYDKFRFIENPTTNLSLVPPEVYFEYLGQYYYSIYECITSGSTDPALAYNKLESGRAWVIVGNDNTEDCLFEPYISNDEDFAQVIYVSEEEEACIYPSPTPSITPSPTQPPLPTPSITPTMTMTPTPSGIPVIDPAALNALWWIDFTNTSTLDIVAGVPTRVSGATDLIASVPFTVENGNPNDSPFYSPILYLGLSGGTIENASPLVNPSSTYTTHHTGFTWFGFIDNDTQASQRGGAFVEAYDGTNFPTGTRFFYVRDTNTPPNIFYTQVKLQSGADLQLGFDLSTTGWTAISVRAYQQSGDVFLEVWENGTQIASTSSVGQSLYTLSNHFYRLMFDGGQDGNTEQFYFDKKLNNSQLSQMFNYLSNKY
jgi:hypothetical protein